MSGKKQEIGFFLFMAVMVAIGAAIVWLLLQIHAAQALDDAARHRLQAHEAGMAAPETPEEKRDRIEARDVATREQARAFYHKSLYR